VKEGFLPVIMGVVAKVYFSIIIEEKDCGQENANDGNEKGGILLEK
jgi:hypothetical protein